MLTEVSFFILVIILFLNRHWNFLICAIGGKGCVFHFSAILCQNILTLMKGDEVVKVGEERANFQLLFTIFREPHSFVLQYRKMSLIALRIRLVAF